MGRRIEVLGKYGKSRINLTPNLIIQDRKRMNIPKQPRLCQISSTRSFRKVGGGKVSSSAPANSAQRVCRPRSVGALQAKARIVFM